MPQVLPAAGVGYREFTQYWQSVGINITDAAALLGAHSAINRTGGDPINWSTEMYVAQVLTGLFMGCSSVPCFRVHVL